MKDKEFSKLDAVKVESHINDLIDQRADMIEKKRTIETEMSNLKTKIRLGGKMDNNVYSSICRKQYTLKKDKDFLETELAALNKIIRAKSTLKEEIRIRVNENSSDIVDSLNQLKAKYQEYSKDYTRVNSTRIMAANFVQEIEKILKTS